MAAVAPMETVAEVVQEPSQFAEPATTDSSASAEELERVLIEFVVDQTGYPEEIVEMDIDLEGDLGIDSIKKAQLFAEVGERYEIAPRADLSLDDFPTLNHVRDFLIEELGISTVSSNNNSHVEETPDLLVEKKTRNSDNRLQSISLTGSAFEKGRQIGEQFRDSICSDLTIMVDSVNHESVNGVIHWPKDCIEEFQGIATEVGVNDQALAVWNTQVQQLDSWPLIFMPVVDNTQQFPQEESIVNVQCRSTNDASYLVIGRPGQLFVQAGINSSRIAISCEPIGSESSAASIITLTQSLHQALGTCQTVHDAEALLSRLNLQDCWCIGLSSTVSPTPIYLYLGSGEIERNSLAGSEQQQAFHQTLIAATDTLEMFDRESGKAHQISIAEFLPPWEFEEQHNIKVVGPDKCVMQRHILRMTESPINESSSKTLTQNYQAGDLVFLIGESLLTEILNNELMKKGCQTITLSVEDLEQQFDQLIDQGTPRHLIFLQAASADHTKIDSFAASDFYLETFEVCRKWLDILGQSKETAGASLSAISRMGGDFGFTSDSPEFAGGGFTGLFKGIRREFSDLKVKVVDFGTNTDEKSVAMHFLDELNQNSSELEIGYINGKRALVQAIPESLTGTNGHPIQKNGVWVITGGGRGVTSEVAREIAKQFSLQLHIVSTAPAPQIDTAWQKLSESELKNLKKQTMVESRQNGLNPIKEWNRIEKSIELDRNLRRMKAEGIRAVYHSCDISNAVKLEAVLNEIRQTSGPIDGIIHGAGVEAACRFVRKKTGTVHATIASKCDGASNLIKLTRQDPLKYFVGFGSTSGRFGGLGQADYSLASDLLAKMTGQLSVERSDCKVVCFHWPAWDDIGMAVRPESKMVLQAGGMSFMPPAEGIAYIINELQLNSSEREILILDKPDFLDADGTMSRSSDVMALQTSQPQATAPIPSSSNNGSARSLIHSIQPNESGEGYIAKVLFDPSKDPFLYHHRLHDTPLLPGVISMEIFSQAAMMLGLPGDFIGLADVDFRIAWVMNEKKSHEAQVLISKTEEGIKCQLTSALKDSAGRIQKKQHVYATATVLIGDAPKIDSIDVGTPALGWTPYDYPAISHIIHGAPFQTCQALDFQHDGGRCQLIGLDSQDLIGTERSCEMLLAPALLDGCLVCCGVYSYCMLENYLGIPRSIKRFQQDRLPKVNENCILRFFYRGRNETGVLYDFTLFGEDGDLIFTVEEFSMASISGKANAIH
ncbi:MAG: KR domain-containing protein [Pirellulales bacterium]